MPFFDILLLDQSVRQALLIDHDCKLREYRRHCHKAEIIRRE